MSSSNVDKVLKVDKLLPDSIYYLYYVSYLY